MIRFYKFISPADSRQSICGIPAAKSAEEAIANSDADTLPLVSINFLHKHDNIPEKHNSVDLVLQMVYKSFDNKFFKKMIREPQPADFTGIIEKSLQGTPGYTYSRSKSPAGRLYKESQNDKQPV